MEWAPTSQRDTDTHRPHLAFNMINRSEDMQLCWYHVRVTPLIRTPCTLPCLCTFNLWIRSLTYICILSTLTRFRSFRGGGTISHLTGMFWPSSITEAAQLLPQWDTSNQGVESVAAELYHLLYWSNVSPASTTKVFLQTIQSLTSLPVNPCRVLNQ